MALSSEEQRWLRDLYDKRVNKSQASKITGVAEATVYRYYTKWDAITSPTAFDIKHLDPKLAEELDIQARMRQQSVYGLVFSLLTVIIEDNMVSSILDIDDDHPAKHRLKNGS